MVGYPAARRFIAAVLSFLQPCHLVRHLSGPYLSEPLDNTAGRQFGVVATRWSQSTKLLYSTLSPVRSGMSDSL